MVAMLLIVTIMYLWQKIYSQKTTEQQSEKRVREEKKKLTAHRLPPPFLSLILQALCY
jgi:hypothetical protein